MNGTYRCEAGGVKVLGTSLSDKHGLHRVATNVSIAELVQRGRSTLLSCRGESGSRSQQGSEDKGLHFQDDVGEM